MIINTVIQLSLLSLLYLYYVVGSASAHTHNEVSHGDTREKRDHVQANTRIHSNRHGIILVTVNVEIEEEIMMPVPISAYRQNGNYKAGDEAAQMEPLRNSVDMRNSNFLSPLKNIDYLWTVSVEEIVIQKAQEKEDGTKSAPIPFSQTIRMEWNKTKESNERVAARSKNHTAPYASVTKELQRIIIHYSGKANCTFMIPLKSDDKLSLAHSVPQTPSSLSRTFIVSLMLSSDGTPYVKSQNENNWIRGQKYTVVARRLATLPRESNSRSQRSIDPVTNVFLHHSQRITHQELIQIPESNTLEDNDSLSGLAFGEGEEHTNTESNAEIQKPSKDKGGLLWTFVLLCTTFLIQSGPLQDKIKSLLCSACAQPLEYKAFTLHGREYRVKDRHDRVPFDEHTIGGEYLVDGGGSDNNSIKDSVTTDRRRGDELESEKGDDQGLIDTEPAHELGEFHNANQQLGEKDVNIRVPATLCGKRNQLFSQRDGETILGDGSVRFGNNHLQIDRIGNIERNQVGCNLYGMALVTERKTGDSITKLNKLQAHSDNIVDRDTETQEMKLNQTEPSMVEDDPSDRFKTNLSPKEIQTSHHATDYCQLGTNFQEKKQNDLSLNNDRCQGVENHNGNDSFFNDNASKRNDCSLQGHETSKVDSAHSEKLTRKIERCEDRLSNTSDLVHNNLEEKNISDNPPPTSDSPRSGQNISSQSQKTRNCKKIKTGENYEALTSQGYRSEESYVSTLPPDSDYASDDDHLSLLSSCHHPEAHPGGTMLNRNRTKNKLEPLSTNANRRKRAKVSPRVGVHSKGSSVSDGIRELHDKKDTFDSVEIVRVVNPVDKLGKRTRRPYRKSNYVADWVPSNELQSMSNDFLEEKSWDITGSTVKKLSEGPPKPKKKKMNPLCSSSTSASAHKKRFHGRER